MTLLIAPHGASGPARPRVLVPVFPPFTQSCQLSALTLRQTEVAILSMQGGLVQDLRRSDLNGGWVLFDQAYSIWLRLGAYTSIGSRETLIYSLVIQQSCHYAQRYGDARRLASLTLQAVRSNVRLSPLISLQVSSQFLFCSALSRSRFLRHLITLALRPLLTTGL